jgi:ParB-like chromosome segregation protein Spo0J
MSSNSVSDDEAFHEDKQLAADLATINVHITRYVLRMLDADASRAEPLSVADERRFAQTLCTMADRLEQRADRRAASDTPSALEDDVTLRRLNNGRPSERR